MLRDWLLPQLAAEGGDYILQQDGAPAHWHQSVRSFLNDNLPNRWIGRAGPNDQHFCKWPPRSPDLTVCDFYLWGVCEGQGLCTSTTQNPAWTSRTHPCSCQQHHTGYASGCVVGARLPSRCLPRNRWRAHRVFVILINITKNFLSLCKYCKSLGRIVLSILKLYPFAIRDCFCDHPLYIYIYK